MEAESDGKSNPLGDYEAKKHVYEALCTSLKRLMGELLHASGLEVLSISGRVKTKESLAEKISRPGKQYKKLSDITDLVGLRIVTFFEDDVDAVAGLLEREFSLVQEHCVDKRAYVEPDKFGYRSLHNVCLLSEPRRSLTENASFSGELFEVQVRSILQHAWAEIEHDLGYKGAITIPNEIKRQLSRVSGLLEIADRDFREIRDKSRAYRAKASNELKRQQTGKIKLDSISVTEFILNSDIVKELDAYLHEELGYRIVEETDFGTTLQMLQMVGITTVDSLQRSLRDNLEFLKRYSKTVLRNPPTTSPPPSKESKAASPTDSRQNRRSGNAASPTTSSSTANNSKPDAITSTRTRSSNTSPRAPKLTSTRQPSNPQLDTCRLPHSYTRLHADGWVPLCRRPERSRRRSDQPAFLPATRPPAQGPPRAFARRALTPVLLLLLLDRLPRSRHKRTLEEGIVYDILFVIFPFDDPVPGVNSTPPKISNNRVILRALTRFHQQGPTCAKSIHGLAPSVLTTDKNHSISQPIKKT